MKYIKYQNARNASWNLLVDLKIKELPIKVTDILKRLEIPVFKYNNSQRFIHENGLDLLVKTSDGFTVFINNRYYIFYDETKSNCRKRFTLAHELGHIACNHLFESISTGIRLTTRNTEPMLCDNLEEQEANVFASRLLAPACVLHELGVTTAEQIAEICHISYQSAVFRLKRLMQLEKRNKDFLRRKGHGCFYMDTLEKEVRNQFNEYILANKL